MQLCDDFFFTTLSMYNGYFHFLQLITKLRSSYLLTRPLTAGVPCSLADDRKDRLPTGDRQSIFAGRALANLSSTFSLVTGDRLATFCAGSVSILHAKVVRDGNIGLDDSPCTRFVFVNISKRSQCMSSVFALHWTICSPCKLLFLVLERS